MASTSSAQASVGFLSAADDLLTKLLLDYSIFNEPRLDGRATGKMMRFARELRMSDKEVASARELVDKLRQGVVSVPDGLDTLLSLPCVKTFNQKWDDEPLFAHHAKRYIIALRPDSGIAFHETDRYKNPRGLSKSRPMPPPVAAKLRRDPSTFIEVGVFATRAFKKGEVVNLRGGIADLTEEEDDEMRDEGGRSDFSVLWSQRKECFCLLLGPARFVNHDCRNNVEFQLTGTNMAFKVLEDVAKDEELFTHYGEHYFEHDNASCLCATCEQLKQGAFAPARPKAVAAVKPRASSPTPASRRSRRASTIAAPDYNEARSSTSTSAAAAAAAPRAGRAAALSRSASTPSLSARASARPRPRSSRMNPTRGELSPADALRGQPRLIVQPKLAPPPGYARDYHWDPKKRIARYTGPKSSSVNENPASSKADLKRKADSAPASTASTSTSAVAPAKRGRPRSSTAAAANDSSPAPSSTSSPRKAKKPRVSQVVLKQVRVGERSSTRQAALGKEPTSARGRAESTKLRQVTALGRAGEAADSSELSEAEDGDEDEVMGAAAAVEAQEDEEVEAMLSPARHARGPSSSSKAGPASPLPFAMPASSRHRDESSTSVTLSAAPTRSSRSLTSDTSASAAPSATVALRSVACDVGMSTSTPIEESHSPQLRGASFEDDLEDDKDALPARKGNGNGKGPPGDEPDAPREPISAPTSNFYGALGVGASALSDSAGGGGGAGAGAGAASQPADFRSGPSQEGGPRSTSRLGAGSSGGGGGGGVGAGGGGDDGDGRRPGGGRIPVDMMDEDEEEEKPNTGEEDGEQEQGKGGAVAPSGEVQAASEGAPAVEEEGRARAPPSDPEDAAAALLMLLCAPPQPQTPSSTAPTPPHVAESTNPSATTSASTSASGEASSSRSNVRRGRTSNESRASPGPSLNPRSTRRHSKLPEPPEPSASEAGTSASASRKGKKKARMSDAEPASLASERRRSTTRSGAAAAASAVSQPGPPPSLEARRTRSQPLPGKLADVLYAPETLAATGGYDYEKGRYISKFEATRDPSHNPLPPRRPSPTPEPTPSPSPPPPPVRKPAPLAKASRPQARSPPVAAPSTPRTAPVASTSRPPSAASGSSARAPAPATSSAPPDGVRSTRRSFPIAGPLRDLIYSPAAVAANGGWDAAAGKYVSAASASPVAPPASTARRASSASVEGGAASSSSRRKRPGSPARTATSSSAPPADVRSTRRSFPMANTRMADLVYSPAARLVSGGWDPALGRYVSASKGEPSTGGAATPRRG